LTLRTLEVQLTFLPIHPRSAGVQHQTEQVEVLQYDTTQIIFSIVNDHVARIGGRLVKLRSRLFWSTYQGFSYNTEFP